MRHGSRLLIGGTAAVLLAACGSSTEPNANLGTLSARVNGVALTATSANATISGAGNFVLANITDINSPQVTLRLFAIGQPGTYPLGLGAGSIGGMGDVSQGGGTYTTPLSGAAGTVTLTTVSTTRLVGTFTFTAQRQTFTGPEAVTVTNGAFDVPVTGTGSLEIPANVGNAVTGTVNGQAFTAPSVTVAQAPSGGALLMTLRQGSNVLRVTMPGVSAVGSYAISDNSARWLQFEAGTGASYTAWGGTNASSAGTVAITSITNARMRGTITGTLQPTFAGLNTPPCAVQLTFDIGLP